MIIAPAHRESGPFYALKICFRAYLAVFVEKFQKYSLDSLVEW